MWTNKDLFFHEKIVLLKIWLEQYNFDYFKEILIKTTQFLNEKIRKILLVSYINKINDYIVRTTNISISVFDKQ